MFIVVPATQQKNETYINIQNSDKLNDISSNECCTANKEDDGKIKQDTFDLIT